MAQSECSRSCSSLSEMPALAREFSSLLTMSDTVAFYGDVGVGKTTFISMVIKNLINSAEVVSPTYQLIKTYKSELWRIAHVDLYRIESIRETVNLGMDEIMDTHLTFIEWPHVLHSLIDEFAIKVVMSRTDDMTTFMFSSLRRLLFRFC